MDDRIKKPGNHSPIEEAIDTLSSLVELDIDDLSGRSADLKQTNSLQELCGVDEKGLEETVKKTFRVILKHLQSFYQKEYRYDRDPNALEEIKMIMVLVGEAAKKLDKYHHLFRSVHSQNISEMKEFKKLQAFYTNHVAHKIDDEVLGKWLIELTKRILGERTDSSEVQSLGIKNHETRHVFIDLDSVKKDTEYELFLLRKEDGSRFFSPKLIRNIKLINDFGGHFNREKEVEVYLDTPIYLDKIAHDHASTILGLIHREIANFYSAALTSKKDYAVASFNKALIALMLAANTHNIMHQLPIKNCCDYFHDFQYFFRECLSTKEHKRAVAYPNEILSPVASAMNMLLETICRIIYLELNGYQSVMPLICQTIQCALIDDASVDTSLSDLHADDHSTGFQLAREYRSMTKMLRYSTDGPLKKNLNEMANGDMRAFDPFIQDNLPSRLFNLWTNEAKFNFYRWPSPTVQEYVNKAEMIEEFKVLMQHFNISDPIQKCLIFNFQDRTLWKDYCRCEIIENISKNPLWNRAVSVVTLAKDTEFYHQQAPYHNENHASIFIAQFKNQMTDPMGGFFFDEEIKKLIMNTFVDGGLKIVHRIFFSGKNVLNQQQRQDFIEIFYILLQLKIIDILQPAEIAFTCKDGIDVTCTAATELCLFLKILSQEHLSDHDFKQCQLMLYGPSLIIRERVILGDRFNRMISALKVIESTKKNLGHANYGKLLQLAFEDLYDSITFDNCNVDFPS